MQETPQLTADITWH